MKSDEIARKRALLASRAVTMGGVLMLAACGTTDSSTGDAGTLADSGGSDTSGGDTGGADVDEDTSVDAGGDAETDTAPDVLADAGPGCSDELDGVCPEDCIPDNDHDCCLDPNWGGGPDWCSYDPEFGCGCAVEGPFAPPAVLV